MARILVKPKDATAGGLFVAIGAAFLFAGRTLRLGSSSQMGPGYFPLVLAGLLILFGIALVIRSFFGEREEMESFSARSSLPILAGSLCFALLLFNAGLALALVIMVLVGCVAARDIKPLQAMATAVVLAVLSVIVFVVLLGQPIPIIGTWFIG